MTYAEHDDDQVAGRLRIGLWRRILGHARPYRRSVAGLAACGVGVACIDAVLPWITGRVVDDAVRAAPRRDLWIHCLAYFGLIAATAGMVWTFIVLAGRIATGYAYSVRRAAFAHLQELSFSYFDRRPVGWLMARMISDSGRLADIMPWVLLDTVWGTTLILAITIMMLALNAWLALCVLLIVPPLFLASLLFQRRILAAQRRVRKINSSLTASFHEAILGARTTKSMVREEENLGEFRELAGGMYEHSVRGALLSAAYLPIVLTVGSAGMGLALWQGGVRLGGGLSYGTLVAFMQYAALFYIPIQEVAGRLTDIQAAQASAERLQGLLDTEPEIKDGADLEKSDGVRIHSVEFRGVSFAYRAGEEVLSDFSLKVRQGETVALVGATGGGKSTVVSLLSRFYEPSAGAILVNGIDYRRLGLRWYQSQFGIVLQAPHLFSGTIRENIRYGKAGATDEEVEGAARKAHANRFITALEQGYGTEVGEGGNRLSVGQKQLVSLARAVLADPQILILDEATSSVDTETEHLIQEGIASLLHGRISFMVAHRLSTVRMADRILVLDHGRVVEQGRHEELLRRRGMYHHLYTGHAVREREERILEEIRSS